MAQNTAKELTIVPGLSVSKANTTSTMSPTSLEEKLKQHLLEIANLKQSIAEMRSDTKDNEERYSEHSNELKEENRRSMERIQELEERLIKMSDMNKEEVDRVKDLHENALRDLNNQNYESQNKKDSDINRLNDKLKEYSHFLDRELRLQHRIADTSQNYRTWKDQYERDKIKHSEIIMQREKEAEIQQSKMRYEQELKLREEKYRYKEDAQEEVYESLVKTQEENAQLQEDLLLQRGELEQLGRQKEKLAGDNRGFKRDVAIEEEGTLEYQAINYRQANKIRKIKEKIQYLKNFIAQEVSKYKTEIEIIKKQNQHQVAEREEMNAELKEQLRIKSKEIKNLKVIAQKILDQKSEIEEFFLESINYVKEEINKKTLQETTKKSASRFPEILTKSKSDLNVRPKIYSDKMDFSSLSWEDKEKILRVLFSRMTSGNSKKELRVPNNVYRVNASMTQEKSIEDAGIPHPNSQPFFSPKFA